MSFKNQASECDLKYEEFDFFLSSVTPMPVFGFYQVARSVFKLGYQEKIVLPLVIDGV